MGGVPIKAWIRGVSLEDAAAKTAPQRGAPALRTRLGGGDARRSLGRRRHRRQRHPDRRARSSRPRSWVGHRLRHGGGPNHADRRAICPRACAVRAAIERAVPHGRTTRADATRAAWEHLPAPALDAWERLEAPVRARSRPSTGRSRARTSVAHLGTLGTGNHFIEVCLDEDGLTCWFMLH